MWDSSGIMAEMLPLPALPRILAYFTETDSRTLNETIFNSSNGEKVPFLGESFLDIYLGLL